MPDREQFITRSLFNDNNTFRNEIDLVFVGPSHWGETYHTCLGKHQSPINIEEHNVKNVSLPPLKLIGIDNPYQSYVTNNGHTGKNFTVRFYIRHAVIETLDSLLV